MATFWVGRDDGGKFPPVKSNWVAAGRGLRNQGGSAQPISRFYLCCGAVSGDRLRMGDPKGVPLMRSCFGERRRGNCALINRGFQTGSMNFLGQTSAARRPPRSPGKWDSYAGDPMAMAAVLRLPPWALFCHWLQMERTQRVEAAEDFYVKLVSPDKRGKISVAGLWCKYRVLKWIF